MCEVIKESRENQEYDFSAMELIGMDFLLAISAFGFQPGELKAGNGYGESKSSE